MLCPYCSKEMVSGYLNGDGRATLRFLPHGKPHSFIEKTFTEKAIVTPAEYSFFTGFRLDGFYCSGCKKLIFDAEVHR